MPTQHPEAQPVPLATSSDPLINFSADGITLESLLRENSSSRTYLGHRSDGQNVHVWIAAEHLTGDAAFLARFRQEAAQLVSLHHMHVETCYGYRSWTTPEGRSLVALVEDASTGISLGDLARREALPVRDVLRLLHQACAGLAVAHRVGIVHGDITLDTVLVTAGGAAKLRAFALGVSGYSAGRAGRSLIGTPDFMAPEVGRGQQPSALSDLYGIGVVLTTLLIGGVPFPAATALEVIHLHGSAPVPDLTATEFAVMAPLIARLMAKDPAQRWMSTDDLARDLLVLSNQIAGELRCHPWSGRRSVPLSALVQMALAQRREETRLLPPPKERSSGGTTRREETRLPPPKERSSGGTTTISRSSIDFFRNPEMFKPTGLTPATDLPILLPSSGLPPTTRTIRRVAAAGSAVAAPSATPELTTPPKTASYLSHLAAAQPAVGSPPVNVPSRSTKRSVVWLTSVFLLMSVVSVVVLAVRAHDEGPTLQPLANAPAVPVERPAADNQAQRITEIVALGTRDPAAALGQAAALRRERPMADLSRLPVALHLRVQGPEVSTVRVSRNGEPVAVSPGLLLCRVRGEPLSLRIDAAGFRSQEVEIRASSADEVTHSIAVLNEPYWTMQTFAPAWVRLLSTPDGVLLASDHKVVLISSVDGGELRRLDRSGSSMLPEKLIWSSVLSVAPDKLRLGITGGLCIDVGVAALIPVRELHRGKSSVLALQVLPLTLRLGEEGMFLVEREVSGFTLAVDNHERRLWSRPLKGGLVPWICTQGDNLLVIGDHQIQRFSQEGEEIAAVALPAPRTGEPVVGGAAGVFIPTTSGVIRLVATLDALPGPVDPVNACVGDATLIVAACGRDLVAWDIVGESVKPRWSHREVVAADRRLVHLTLTAGCVIAVDDQGVVRMFARAEGTAMRTVWVGAALLAPPILSGERLVTVSAPGVVSAY